MLSRILVASDASEASDHVMECVAALRHVGSRHATLVHVFHVREVGGLYESLEREVRPVLERQAARLRDAGFEVDIETPLGLPAHELSRIALEREAGLMVAGSHGASLAREKLLGATASELLHRLQLPFLLIRLQITEEDGGQRCRAVCQGLFSSLLFPTDFSDNAAHAFLYLEHLVREAHSRVVLLHVQDRTKIERHLRDRLEEFNRIDEERLAGMKARLEQCGATEVTAEIPYGVPSAEILNRSRKGDCSLIVMGAQGRGYFEEVFLGSVAGHVARLAPLPVLFVPALK